MRSTSPLLVLVLGSLLLTASCSAPGGGQPTETTSADITSTPEYVDIFDFLTTHGGPDGFVSAVQALNDDFANECGDTYCGSDYSNLTPLAFDCSVSRTRGDVRRCEYVFAGSYQSIEGSSGNVVVHSKVFQCPVTLKGTAVELVAAITATAASPLHNALPGGTNSVYDALGGCLP